MNGKVGGFLRRSLTALALVSSLASTAYAETATGSAPFVLPTRRAPVEAPAAPAPADPDDFAARRQLRAAEFLEEQPRLDDAGKTRKLEALKVQVQLQQAALEQRFREAYSSAALDGERGTSLVNTGLTLFVGGLGVGLLGAGGVVYGELEEPSLTTPSVVVVSVAGAAFITGMILMASGG